MKFCCDEFRVIYEDRIIQYDLEENVFVIRLGDHGQEIYDRIHLGYKMPPRLVKGLNIYHCPFCGVPLLQQTYQRRD